MNAYPKGRYISSAKIKWKRYPLDVVRLLMIIRFICRNILLGNIKMRRENVADEVYWKNCITSDTRSEYRNYLAQFPNGRHRTEAQQKIDGVDWSNILSWGFIIAVIIILTIVLSNN